MVGEMRVAPRTMQLFYLSYWISATGPVRALNVSVAAGVVLFEAVRQRTKP